MGEIVNLDGYRMARGLRTPTEWLLAHLEAVEEQRERLGALLLPAGHWTARADIAGYGVPQAGRVDADPERRESLREIAYAWRRGRFAGGSFVADLRALSVLIDDKGYCVSAEREAASILAEVASAAGVPFSQINPDKRTSENGVDGVFFGGMAEIGLRTAHFVAMEVKTGISPNSIATNLKRIAKDHPTSELYFAKVILPSLIDGIEESRRGVRGVEAEAIEQAIEHAERYTGSPRPQSIGALLFCAASTLMDRIDIPDQVVDYYDTLIGIDLFGRVVYAEGPTRSESASRSIARAINQAATTIGERRARRFLREYRLPLEFVEARG